jgi:hypothetical protein
MDEAEVECGLEVPGDVILRHHVVQRHGDRFIEGARLERAEHRAPPRVCFPIRKTGVSRIASASSPSPFSTR